MQRPALAGRSYRAGLLGATREAGDCVGPLRVLRDAELPGAAPNRGRSLMGDAATRRPQQRREITPQTRLSVIIRVSNLVRHMRRALLTLTVALGLLASAPLGAEDLVYARFGDLLDSLRVQLGIPGMSAAIIGRNDVLWERAFGHENLERSSVMRMDTPMHIDGLTETFTATLVLRCVEEGKLTLDTPIASQTPGEPPLTIRQILTHTSGSTTDPVYSYRPDRLAQLAALIRQECTGDSFRETLANLFDRLAMSDSVPGPDVLKLVPPQEGVLTSEFDRYQRVLDRLATGYAVDAKLKATPTQYSATTLTATGGVVTTVRNLQQLDLALKDGDLLLPETVAAAWQPPATASGQRLPHGMGWFVQDYLGQTVLWQFGGGDNGSSSLLITWPARNLTFVVVANSAGLVKGFNLSGGDLQTSPFGRLFLNLFIR